MRIWLIKVGEPLPGDPDAGRPYRMGLLAQELVARGNDVTWWSSSFNHVTKRHRTPRENGEDVSSTFRVVQLRGCAYRRNVSWARIRNHRQEARAFVLEAATRPTPDLILSAYPTIDLSVEAVAFGADRGIPVLLDVRDLWPDIFLDVLPRLVHPFARRALRGPYRRKEFAFRKATGIIGTSETFVDWGVQAAARQRNEFDRAIPHAYPRVLLADAERARAEAFWLREFKGDIPDRIVCYFGNFSNAVADLETVIRAARRLEECGEEVAFVLCGTGPSWGRAKEVARGLRSVYLPGRRDLAEMRVLMEKALGGLVPYVPRWDFKPSLPNKVGEYLSAGLPIVTCLTGELSALLARHGCGVVYTWGDADSLVDAVRTLTSGDKTLVRMRDQATALYEQMFDATRVYADFAAHLETVAASHR